MHKGQKIAIVLVAVALIAVIGLILLSHEAAEPAPAATSAPTAEPTAEPVNEPDNTQAQADSQTADDAAQQQAQDEAQNDTLYEGALAGLSEEEIAALAMAEEGHGEGFVDEVREEPVD